jgi:hypothetical protein
VVTPDMVAVMATFFCYDMASTVTTRSREVALASWTMAMVAVKLDGATLEAAEAMATTSGSKAGGVAMTKDGSEWIWAWAKVELGLDLKWASVRLGRLVLEQLGHRSGSAGRPVLEQLGQTVLVQLDGHSGSVRRSL